jgi:hypothetical protein
MFVAPVIFAFFVFSVTVLLFLVFFCTLRFFGVFLHAILSEAAVIVPRKLKFGQYLIKFLRSLNPACNKMITICCGIFFQVLAPLQAWAFGLADLHASLPFGCLLQQLSAKHLQAEQMDIEFSSRQASAQQAHQNVFLLTCLLCR